MSDQKFKTVLAIESSTPFGSVALLRDERVISALHWKRTSSRGEVMLPAIETCLKQAQLNINQIDLIAVDHGPGSYTGIRIAINTAKTLTYVLEKRIYCVNSLRLLAEAVPPQEKKILSVMNSFNNGVFVAMYEPSRAGLREVLVPSALPLNDIPTLINEPLVCVGDGYQLLKLNLSPDQFAGLIRPRQVVDYPSAETLGQIALRDVTFESTLVWNEVTPLYIRPSSAEEKLRKGLAKQS